MIGKAYVSVTKYYDSNLKKMSFKKRPVLIIGKADSSDYVVLPISRITNSIFINSKYDIPITPQDFPLMNLKQTSYIRTNKQTVVNLPELVSLIVDFRKEYNEKFEEIIKKVEKFQTQMIDDALL